MNKFAIYYFQFDRDNGQEKKENSTMVGEVNLSSKVYANMDPKDACWERIKKELSYNKNRAAEQDIDHVINFDYQIVESDKDAGVDKVLHKYFKNVLGINPLKSDRGTDTEEFNMGENYLIYIQEAISKCFGKIKTVPFIPRNNQKKCINKMCQAFKKGIKKFLIGAVCRFGKTAMLLHFFTQIMPMKHILVISAKCDVQQSWQNDYFKFIGNDKYEFFLKKDLKEKGLPDKPVIVMVSFQSAAKDYNNFTEIGEDEQIAETKANKKWQEEIVKYDWDVVIIDECHYGADTSRSQNFLKEIFNKNKNTLKVEVTATYYSKALRQEYNNENAFIYDLQDEKLDYLAGNL